MVATWKTRPVAILRLGWRGLAGRAVCDDFLEFCIEISSRRAFESALERAGFCRQTDRRFC
jgi:hypothetical protein